MYKVLKSETIDVRYMKSAIDERIQVLCKRYNAYSNGHDEYGSTVTYASGANIRSRLKQEVGLLNLVADLLSQIHKEDVLVSVDAQKAFDRLVTPTERFRRLMI